MKKLLISLLFFSSQCEASSFSSPVNNVSIATLTSSATPVISVTNPTELFIITLSANATPTLTGIIAGLHPVFEICQPSSGGPYTWTWPSSVHGGMTIGTTANTCSIQSFYSFNGTTLVAESTGAANVAP